MNKQTAAQPITRGRKPIGEHPMTAAERKRRSRELQRAAGERTFMLRVSGAHLDFLEMAAQASGTTVATQLHGLLELTLDRVIAAIRIAGQEGLGKEDEDTQLYWFQKHLFPALVPTTDADTNKEGS